MSCILSLLVLNIYMVAGQKFLPNDFVNLALIFSFLFNFIEVLSWASDLCECKTTIYGLLIFNCYVMALKHCVLGKLPSIALNI